MEIYAIYNGRQAVFNQRLNELLPAGSPPVRFITLQVIFDDSLDTFAYNDYSKFVLYNVNIDDVQAMFPQRNVTVTVSGLADIISTLFKVVLKGSASGYFVKTKIEVLTGKKVFDLSEEKEVEVLTQTAFDKFLVDVKGDITTFACSVSKTGGPCI